MKAWLSFVFLLSILVGSTVLQANEGSLWLDLNEDDIIQVRFMDKTAINLKLSDSTTLNYELKTQLEKEHKKKFAHDSLSATTCNYVFC